MHGKKHVPDTITGTLQLKEETLTANPVVVVEVGH